MRPPPTWGGGRGGLGDPSLGLKWGSRPLPSRKPTVFEISAGRDWESGEGAGPSRRHGH